MKKFEKGQYVECIGYTGRVVAVEEDGRAFPVLVDFGAFRECFTADGRLSTRKSEPTLHHVSRIELFKAWEQGACIEHRLSPEDSWLHVPTPTWRLDAECRIKPEKHKTAVQIEVTADSEEALRSKVAYIKDTFSGPACSIE